MHDVELVDAEELLLTDTAVSNDDDDTEEAAAALATLRMLKPKPRMAPRKRLSRELE